MSQRSHQPQQALLSRYLYLFLGHQQDAMIGLTNIRSNEGAGITLGGGETQDAKKERHAALCCVYVVVEARRTSVSARPQNGGNMQAQHPARSLS